MRLGFLGTGKMGTAICKGLTDTGTWPAADICGADIAPAARHAFKQKTGAKAVENAADMVAQSDAVVVAVKPQIAERVLTPLASLLGNKLVISIAAGIPLAKLTNWVGHNRVVRVMPNTPMMIGCGAAVFCCENEVTASDRGIVETILGAVGVVLEMPEQNMDAVTALSGSGPAYVFELMQALIDAAVALGLQPEDARRLTAHTVAGAAEMVKLNMGTPDELRDAVTSPGGTTEAGLSVLTDHKFRHLMSDVLRRARDRSVELGKGQ